MPEESLETRELQETLEKALERAEHAGAEKAAPPWTLYLSLSTALIAVLAAVASLRSGALSNHALFYKNEAVLSQAKASDQWSYYQAKGIKALLYATQAEMLMDRNPTLVRQYQGETTRYKEEQTAIKKQADELEARVKQFNEQAEHAMEGHHQFALSVTLFQVAIALAAIAALMRRQALWWVGLVISAGGVFYLLKGFLAS